MLLPMQLLVSWIFAAVVVVVADDTVLHGIRRQGACSMQSTHYVLDGPRTILPGGSVENVCVK